MTTQTEAFKLALNALETERDIYRENDEDGAPEYILEAITAIEEALAQPEQEPAAWRRKRFSPELGEYFEYKRRIFSKETDGEDWTPLYTTPPQPKQEPVGYVSEGEPDRLIAQKQTKTPLRNYRLFTHDVPLYTTPHTKVGCVECGVSGGHAFYCVACSKELFGGYKK